jgi:hypothetical protein
MIIEIVAKVKKADREYVGTKLEPPFSRSGIQFL